MRAFEGLDPGYPITFTLCSMCSLSLSLSLSLLPLSSLLPLPLESI